MQQQRDNRKDETLSRESLVAQTQTDLDLESSLVEHILRDRNISLIQSTDIFTKFRTSMNFDMADRNL